MAHRSRPTSSAAIDSPSPGDARHRAIAIDRHRHVLFPNRMREQRVRHDGSTLLAFAAALPDIPYIRLAKIERGEVFARADELARIAAALGVAPADLLVDVDAAGFDLADWYAPFADGATGDDTAEMRMAVLLAAGMRAFRHADERWNAGAIGAAFGIPPVVLSRIENAYKVPSRWNGTTMAGIFGIFDVADDAALRERLEDWLAQGKLDAYLPLIVDADARRARTRQRIAALRAELVAEMPRRVSRSADPRTDAEPRAEPAPRAGVPVYGAPLGNGLLSLTPVAARVEAPAVAGPRAFGVRVCYATLGGGLPGHATVVVDPDRYPQPGGLALVRDGDGHRIVAVVAGRDGAMTGYATTPPREIAFDALPPGDVAAIVAALYV